MISLFFFFFSSRRRHTRWTGDWSSDVCSSDLDAWPPWPSPPMAGPWRRAAGTASSNSGMLGARGEGPLSGSGRGRVDRRGSPCTSWYSRPTASDWSPGTSLGTCAACGTQTADRRSDLPRGDPFPGRPVGGPPTSSREEVLHDKPADGRQGQPLFPLELKLWPPFFAGRQAVRRAGTGRTRHSGGGDGNGQGTAATGGSRWRPFPEFLLQGWQIPDGLSGSRPRRQDLGPEIGKGSLSQYRVHRLQPFSRRQAPGRIATGR